MLTRVVEETNKYYLQKNGTPLGMTIEELTSVLGMFFRMGLVDMHNVRAYWEQGSRYELVAQVMSWNRFEKITSHLHFVDNDAATEKTMKDKCWKVRPWLSELRKNMLKIPQETKSCIDETDSFPQKVANMAVPAKQAQMQVGSQALGPGKGVGALL